MQRICDGSSGRPAKALAVCAAVIVLASGTAIAFQSSPASAPTLTGRSFDGINLPTSPQAFPIGFRAIRAWSWTEASGSGGTDRLLLEGDVRIEIGGYDFSATRAAVWIEPVDVVDSDGNRASADQLAVYLENVRDPGGRPGPEPGVGQSADRLLVTGLIVRQAQGLSLRVDRVEQGRPSGAGSASDAAKLNAEAEARLARYLSSLAVAADQQDTPGVPDTVDRPPRTDVIVERVLPSDPFALADENEFVDDRPARPANPGSLTLPGPAIGTVTFSAPQIVIEPDDETGGYAVMFTSGVGLVYELDGRSGSRQLTAERAVVFLESGADAASATFRSTEVAGVYLEGDVNLIAVDTPSGLIGEERLDQEPNRYTLRGSKVYYDLRSDRAVLLDAVFWTYDAQRGMPLYLRAESIRKESDNQFGANNATLANVAFAEPHFSIGVDSVTLTRRQRPDGSTTNAIEARGVGFKAGDTALLKVPKLSGELRPTPLRRLAFESESGSPIVRTEWDLYSILGIDAATGNSASLLLDGYLDRGVGVGAEMAWDTSETNGSVFGYFINDNGRDRLTTGERIDRNGENRGLFRASARYRLDEVWSFFGELSYVSDEAFMDAFFEREAETGRDFTSSFFARRVNPDGPENNALTLEVSGNLNDFIVNEYLLQTPGFQTQRFPELAYYTVGSDALGGAMTYYGQTSAGYLKLNLADNDLRDQGFTDELAQDAFGINANQTIADRLKAEGYDESGILRFDSRHELEMPLALGADGRFNLTPFAVGRLTAYDTDFDEFRDTVGNTDTEQYRLWGAIGARLGTSIVKVDNTVGSELFDLTRMRHIIEPTATVWFADSSLQNDALPIYDDSVEAIADGFSYRLGLRNTWQTQRGPRNQQRSVDWLTLDTNYTWADDDVRIDSPYGRFIEFRPETSFFGEFLSNRATLMLTDALALTGDWTYDTDENTTRRIAAGGMIDHGYGYTSYLEYRSLDVVDSQLLQAGTRYELTRKYAMELYATWDLDEDDVQRIGTAVERRFPQWTLDVGLDYDNIEDNFSLGFALRPLGFAGETRTRIFTRGEDSIDTLASPARLRATRLTSGPFAR